MRSMRDWEARKRGIPSQRSRQMAPSRGRRGARVWRLGRRAVSMGVRGVSFLEEEEAMVRLLKGLVDNPVNGEAGGQGGSDVPLL